MSLDSALKSKWLPLILAVAFAGTAHAGEDKPRMSYGPTAASGTPAVAAAPAITAPTLATKPAEPAPAAAKAAEPAARTSSPSAGKTGCRKTPVCGYRKAAHKASRKASTRAAVEDKKDVTYNPQTVNEITVSDHDLNDFVFSSPISNGPILPAGVPLVGKPIYMANNTQVLLQFRKGYDKPIQAVVETEDGKVHKLYLKPRPVPGVTYAVDGARALPRAASNSQKADAVDGGQPGARAEDIELLKRVVRGDIPAEFESVALPRPTRFDKFTVVPLAGWSDGAKKIMVFNLVGVPGQTAVVAPPQFYRQGISAVMITGDHVSESTSPQLFVVEELNNE